MEGVAYENHDSSILIILQIPFFFFTLNQNLVARQKDLRTGKSFVK